MVFKKHGVIKILGKLQILTTLTAYEICYIIQADTSKLLLYEVNVEKENEKSGKKEKEAG